MRPVHDIDVVILLATALAAKRRPAQLVEIVAAAELVQGFIPFVEKMAEALQRLSSCGLIGKTEACFTLTPAAQALMADLPKKTAAEARTAAVKGHLAAYTPQGESAPLQVPLEQLSAAIQLHKTSRNAPGKSVLMPKPKMDRHFKVEGRWRRASATQGRKS